MTRTDLIVRPLSYNLIALAALTAGGCVAPTGDVEPSQFASDSADVSGPQVAAMEPDGTPRMRPVAPLEGGSDDTPEDTPDDPPTDQPDPVPAQVAPTWMGDFVASFDSELDAFCAAGFTEVKGSVRLGGDITDLSLMDCLTSVRGDLAVTYAPNLYRVDAFNHLTEVGGDVRFANLAGMELLLGFDSLGTLAGSLEIIENRVLREMLIAPTLPEVGGSVRLIWNDTAERMELLGETWRIGGDYVMDRFASAEELPYLPALVVVHGSVRVLDNPDLQGIESLFGLERIDGDLVIDENPAIGNENAADAGGVMADIVGGAVMLGRNGA